MNIKKAIVKYNEKKKPNEPKMTQERLTRLIMPEVTLSTARQMVSYWDKGERYTICKLQYFRKMCRVLKVSPDFMFEGIDVSKIETKESNLDALVQIMKYTGKKPSHIIKL